MNPKEGSKFLVNIAILNQMVYSDSYLHPIYIHICSSIIDGDSLHHHNSNYVAHATILHQVRCELSIIQNLIVEEDFSDLFAGATPSTKVSAYWENGTIPWMSSGEVHMGRVTSTEKKISQLGYDKCSTKMVPLHTVVIALAGQGKTRGTVAVTEIELCTNQSLCAMVTDGTVLSDYLYHNLRNRYEEIRNMCAIADGRGGLNLKIVGSIKVIVPSIEEQKQFVAFAEQSDKSKFELKEAIKSCDALMKAILFTNLEEKEG